MNTKPRRILIIDDDDRLRRIYKVWLSKAGFICVDVCDGEKALKIINDTKFDLILSDIMMPRVTGFDVCREVRIGDNNRNTPIILLSSMKEIEHGINQGATDYLVKPISYHLLIVKVTSLIDSHQKVCSINPLSGLPGSMDIKEHCEHMLNSHQDFAMAYFDIDNFKPYNDCYGYDSGDIVIADLANILRECKSTNEFLCHIGGDDFVVIMPSIDHVDYCSGVTKMFIDRVESYYNEEHVKSGYIESKDRKGLMSRFDLMKISVGVTTTTNHPDSSYHDLTKFATECKSIAKKSDNKIHCDNRIS